MKPSKTAINGKQPLLKKAAGGKKEKAAAKTVKGSRAGSMAGKKKKPAGTAVTSRDKTSGKDKKSSPKTARIKPESASSAAAAVRRKTPAGKIGPAGKTAIKTTGEEMKPKTGHTAGRKPDSTKVTTRSPGPHIKSAKITGQLSFKKAAVKANEGISVLSEKDTKAPSQAKIGGTIKMIVAPVLPAEYGENEFFLIPVEPRVVYASWEVTQDSLPGEKGGLEIRFFDAMQREYGGPEAQALWGVSIPKRVGDAFFDVGIHGREIIAEIGHLGKDGHFRPLLRSRRVLIPSSLQPGESGISSMLSETGSYGSRPPDES